jgi:hypothetical protein
VATMVVIGQQELMSLLKYVIEGMDQFINIKRTSAALRLHILAMSRNQ